MFFGLILRKPGRKDESQGWKLLKKSQKTVGKPQNRHWELSKFSLRCILEFWNEV